MTTPDETIAIAPFTPADRAGVVALWASVFADDPPWNEPNSVIDAKLALRDELLLVCRHAGRVSGTAMGGYDGHRGWVYAVAVDPQVQRQGIASQLMVALENALRDKGCLKLNLQVRSTNAAVVNFYEALGYDQEDRISMGKLLVRRPEWGV